MVIPKINRSTPLWHSSLLSSQINDDMGKTWERIGVRTIRDFCGGEKDFYFPVLQRVFDIPNNHYFKFVQIKNILALSTPKIKLDKIPFLDTITRRSTRIRNLYTLLLDKIPDDLEKTESSWALKLANPDVDIYMSLSLTAKILLSSNLKAQVYKTIFYLYFTPAKLFT